VRDDFFGPSAWGPLALALVDFHAGRRTATLRVHSDEGELDPMPAALFFRGRDELRAVDREALARVRGRVLDGGAGVGSLTLLLQEEGVEVTAVEVIPEAAEIMRARGVRDARTGRLEDLPEGECFDTVLLLMNGSSLAGTLEGVPHLLRALARLLAPGGQVLMDSTDLVGGDGPADATPALLPAGGLGATGVTPGDSGWLDPGSAASGLSRPDGEDDGWGAGGQDEAYPGEVHYQLEYRGERGVPFPQLFLDPVTLERVAWEEGWEVEVVWSGEDGEYLARLWRAERPDHRSKGRQAPGGRFAL
jgi:SAM-dependent methyltransferase